MPRSRSRSRSPTRHAYRKERRHRSPPPRDYKYEKGDRERDRKREDDRRRDYDDDRRRERERNHSERRLERYDRERDKKRWPSEEEGGRRQVRRRSRSRSQSRSRSRSPSVDKTKPNFGASGLLAAATNTVTRLDGTSTVLKYNEPPEARKPTVGWRLYVFKGDEQIELLHINRQSAYLIGRDRGITEIWIDHPSCSKQHAAIQFRQVTEKDQWGGAKNVVKPFIIDLESTNGTFVNKKAIPASRFYELQVNDVIKFGLSEREYVLLHDDVA